MLQPGGNPGEASTSNFATIKTTSIVSKQQKEHLNEDMHAAMSGYKRMRQEHQRALVKVIWQHHLHYGIKVDCIIFMGITKENVYSKPLI